ncbi:MAG: 4-(cytidine 5'-diphospho)-2-C-methyl-D-erythritol kinase [Gammaproteobacteria bacterium]|nr:4-(cytidine 5'-diphospho)-2-C-methyl-D-erythritol kinase [Gammaproteobacteria bacterium]
MDLEPAVSEVAWPAPAKLNLFLHVVGRRADGYHLLQTVFQFLDYGDHLNFKLRPDRVIRRASGLQGVPPEADLVVRAARALQAVSGTAQGVEIAVAKRLPMGGGLGGGSSNAATVLVALNHLWGTGLSAADLARLGLELGADVPVFVHGQAAWAEGVGERLSPISPPEPTMLVIDPGVSVPTGAIFGHAELTRNTPVRTIHGLSLADCHNDCEPVTRALFPAVGAALDWLRRFAPARMTGTGACVFAPFADRTSANAAGKAVPREWSWFIASACNRSPLITRLAQARGA